MKKILSIFLMLLVLFVLLITSIEIYTTAFIPEHKLSSIENKTWSHAGLIKDSNLKQNTIEAFDNALINKANGLELDVIYDIEMKEFIVSHDFPYQRHGGELLKLASVFHKYQNTTNYWLDFKNLRTLNSKQTKESCEILIRILQTESVAQNNVLIESVNLDNLSHYTNNSFYTSWWILPYKSKYKSIFRDYIHKYYYIVGKFSSLSMPYKYYHRIESHMNNIPINLWTINDPKPYEKYLKKAQVKIILSDQNWFLK
jgi:glycerophosphoryl diester phosphodiesterase